MTYDALKRASDAVATVLDAFDVTVHKPIQGDAIHKVIARAVLEVLPVPAPAVDREGLTETLFEAIDDTDGVIDMCRRQADALISAGLIRESSLARGMADAAAGRVRRRDDFLDDEDGDSGEHCG